MAPNLKERLYAAMGRLDRGIMPLLQGTNAEVMSYDDSAREIHDRDRRTTTAPKAGSSITPEILSAVTTTTPGQPVKSTFAGAEL